MSLWLIAHAKINLFLDVVGKMPDGYHAIRTVFQSISLGDEIEIEKRTRGIRVVMAPRLGVKESDNLANRAARSLLELSKLCRQEKGLRSVFPKKKKIEGVCLNIAKRIPMGAGLGGGSADAAGALAGIGHLLSAPAKIVKGLAPPLGADVPACLAGGTLFGFGRGDQKR